MVYRRRKSKSELAAIYQQGPFSSICNEEQLLQYLQINQNPYNLLMLSFIERKKKGGMLFDEKHHIIPTSEGGPNVEWNLVPVSVLEHKEAHQIRYEVYGKEGDKLAVLGRELLPENYAAFRKATAKAGHKTMKEQNKGFYNSELQRELGKRSGGKKTPPREIAYHSQVSEKYQNVLSKKLSFKHPVFNLYGETPPNTFQRTGQIKDYLLSLIPQTISAEVKGDKLREVSQQELETLREKIKLDRYFSTNINKVLTRIVQPNAGRDSYKGWFVTEITD